MAEEKEIILSVKGDYSDAAQGAEDLKKKLGDVNNTPIDKPFKSFKAEIKEAITDAKRMEDQFGRNSQQFSEAAKRVAELKDRFGEFNQSIAGFNPDNKLQALVNVAKGATGAIQGVTGAMQFMGAESKDATEAIARLQGLMAFSAALNSVDDIKNGLKDMYNVAKNALGSLSKGDLIGLAIVGVTALGAAIVSLTEDTKKEDVALKVLTENIDKLKEATSGAIQKTNQVKVAFDQAKEGVITKDKALKIYNDTLGDTFGKATSLNQAENLYTEKAGTYIKIMGLKAQANALFAASANEAAKGIVASQEDQTGFFDKLKAGVQEYFVKGSSIVGTIEAQRAGEKEAKEEAKRKSDALLKEGEKYATDAENLAKTTHIKLDKVEKDGNDKSLKEREAYLAKLKKFQEDFYQWEIKSGRQQQKDIEDEAEKQRQIDAAEEERQRQIPITNEKNRLDAKKKLATLDLLNNPDSPEKKIEKIKADLAVELSTMADGDLQRQIATRQAEDAIVQIKKDSADQQKAIDEATLEYRLEFYNQIGAGLGQLSNLFGKNTVAGKAAALAEIGIGTATGFIQALDIAQKSAKGTGPAAALAMPIFYASQIAAVLGAASKAKAALSSVKTPSGSSGGGSVGSTPSAPTISTAPIINAAATAQQQIQDVRVTNNSQAPIRAYITNSDLQSNEQKNKFLNNISTF